jgi:hypothetical protein
MSEDIHVTIQGGVGATSSDVECSIFDVLQASDKVSLAKDEANGTITINTSALDEEEVEDVVGVLLTGGSNITVSYDDDNDVITVALDSHGSSHEKGGSDVISEFAETTHDAIDNSDYHESVDSKTVSGTTSLDLSSFNVFNHTLSGNTTFEFVNESSDPKGNSFTLYVRQDGTGGHTLSWPSSVSWHGESVPSPPADGTEVLELTFRTPNAGSDWFGTKSGRFTL